jgi:glycolate oxidase
MNGLAMPGETSATRELSPGVRIALKSILGQAGLIEDPAALLVYESDGMTAYRVAPRAVLVPRSTAEVAAAVRVLADAGIPFVAGRGDRPVRAARSHSSARSCSRSHA